tara:strand:+ start:7626 stop:9431 length:1806 start_codon:yes stop_codon:yes gene_type:complete
MSRKGLFRTLTIPTPKNLVNTSLNEFELPTQFSPRIENMLPVKGKGSTLGKRYGMTSLGEAIGFGEIKKIDYHVASDGAVTILAYCDDGAEARIYTTADQGVSWTNVKSGLVTGGVPHTTVFQSSIVLVDGLNPNMYYDGVLKEMSEFVEDTGANKIWVSSDSVQVEPYKLALYDYQVGKTIKATFGTAGEIEAEISALTYTASTNELIIEVVGTPFPTSTQTLDKLTYEMAPPPFGYIKTMHDRLWAFVGGVTVAQGFKGDKSLTVYFSDVSNALNAWYNIGTQEIPFINLEDKHGMFDELVAMSNVNGYTVFHGKNQMQVWSGVDPSPINGDFTWQRNIPVGTLHANTVREIGNQVVFMTKYGLRTVSSTTITGNVETGSDLGQGVDPTIQEDIESGLRSNESYNNIMSWGYGRDGLYGFRAGNRSVVYQITEVSKGFVFFTGYFSDVTSSAEMPDGTLLLSRADQLYRYANGSSDTTKSYTDAGSVYKAIWETQWIEGGFRLANNSTEIVMQSGNPRQTVRVRRFQDNTPNKYKEFNLELDTSFAEWDASKWDESTWENKESRHVFRDKYIAESVAYEISTQNDKPFEIIKINLRRKN